MSQHTILFVDDEKNILKTLRRLFLNDDYRLLLANSGQEALDLIRGGESPSVIVSDQQMPGMKGAEFLAKSREILPESIRIVLTGHADITAAMDAINVGGVHRYLMKPWNKKDLKLAIRDATERFDLAFRNRELTKLLTEKNIFLEELTMNLDKKIEERTKELQQAYQKNLTLTGMLKKKLKELEGRDRIQQHLLTMHPLEETLDVILEVIIDVVGADTAAVYLNLPAGGFLYTPTTVQSAPAVEGNPAIGAIPEAQIREVISTGTPCCLKLPLYGSEPGQQAMILSHLLMPVKGEDSLFGVITVSKQGQRPLAEEEIRIVGSFAQQATIAIHDAQMHENISALGTSLDEVLANL